MAALALGIVSGIRPARAACTLYVFPGTVPVTAVGSTFTEQIRVGNIDPFNAWDIQVMSGNTVISPQSLTITPNLLAANFTTSVFELINCINGVGTGCTTSDGPGIVHSAVTAFGPPPQTASSSGTLFTITYKVMSGGTFSPIAPFNDIIANGATGQAVVHVTVLSVFYGTAPVADFSLTASPTALSISIGSSGTFTITVGSINGLAGSVGITATSATAGVTASCSPGSIPLPPSPNTCLLTVNVASSVPIGTIATVTVTGMTGAITNTTSITVTAVFIHSHFVHGKLSWTHHLSLAKNPCSAPLTGDCQTFTAHVRDEGSTGEYVVITVTGSNGVGGSFRAQSAPQLLSPGIVTDVTFSQTVDPALVGTKICFTALLYYGATAAQAMALTNLGPNSKSGCMAIVP
jgi:hypothetical protein